MMAGLVADYSSSSDEEKDDEELAEELSSRVGLMQTKQVNFFECPLEKGLHKGHSKKKKKSSTPVEVPPPKPETLANPLRGNALPSPFSDDGSSSVFFNPFHKAQEDKKTVLEKHVKMTDNPKDVLEINGKKICWNYRKGRCKFGHNCKYAHDSDVIQQADPSLETKDNQSSSVEIPLSSWSYGDLANFTLESDPSIEESDAKRKRRPGLSKGLVPNKKALKMYHNQQAKERPWTLKN